jgi:hypothetical protein
VIGPLDWVARRLGTWPLPPVVFLVVSVGLILALLGDGVFAGHVLSQADILYLYYPWRAYAPPGFSEPANVFLADVPQAVYPAFLHAADAVRNGTWPLWAAGLSGGNPFLAASVSAVFSPFHAIIYLVPLPQATVVIAFAVLLVGGLGMFGLVRSFGLGWAASFFAGIAFLLNSFSVTWLEYPLTPVTAWAPWVLLITERIVRSSQRKDAVLLALAVALLLFCGHLETAFKVLLLCGSYGLVRALTAEVPSRALGLLTTGYAAGVLLGAIQILPYVEYLGLSRQYMVRQSLPVNAHFPAFGTLITGLVPNFWGTPADGNYLSLVNRRGQGATYVDHQLYPGMATWLLAAVGLVWARRELRVLFFAIAGVLGTLLMYGTPGLIDVLSKVPVFDVLAWARFGSVTIISAIVLAAYGVEALTRGATTALASVGDAAVAADEPPGAWKTSRTTLWVPAAGVAFVVVVAVAASLWLARPLLYAGRLSDQTVQYSAVAIGLTGCVLGLIVLRGWGWLATPLFSGAVTLVLAGDLLFNGRGFHQLVPPEQVFPTVPEIEMVKRDPGLFRVGGSGKALLPNTAMAYGLQDFRGYDGHGYLPYGALLDPSFDFDGWLRAPGFDIARFDPMRFEAPALLDLLNVKYVFGEPGNPPPAGRYTQVGSDAAPVYRNEDVLPRAFLVDQYQVAPENATRELLRTGGVDSRRVVLLGTEPSSDERPEPVAALDDVGSAVVRHYRDTFVEIETDAGGRRMLVLTDVHYPGWQASIDGRPANTHAANLAFRAVSIPAGRHTVRFEYRPMSFTVGATVSAASLVSLVTWLLVPAWARLGTLRSSNRREPLRVGEQNQRDVPRA